MYTVLRSSFRLLNRPLIHIKRRSSNNSISRFTIQAREILNKSEDKECTDENLAEMVFNERKFEEMTPDNFKELISTDADRERIATILDNYELIKYESGQVPTVLKLEHMKNMLDIESDKQFRRYISGLFKNEYTRLYNRARKLIRSDQFSVKLQEELDACGSLKLGIHYDENGRPLYGKWRNSYFSNLSNAHMQTRLRSSLWEGVMFGPNLVFDCSFEDKMNQDRASTTIRRARDSIPILVSGKWRPNIWFTNVANGSLCQQSFAKLNFSVNLSFINVVQESYLDLFSRNELIYLSPDASEILSTFEHNKTYIIGALHDTGPPKPITLAKAKSEKIRCAKLPLDKYFRFKSHKVLNILEMCKILSIWADTGDFRVAGTAGLLDFRIKSDEEIIQEQKIREQKLMRIKKTFFL